MYELRYLEQAKIDLLRIKRYIAKESGSKEVALRYTKKLRQQCQKLASLRNPHLVHRQPDFSYFSICCFSRRKFDLKEFANKVISATLLLLLLFVI